MINIGVDIGDLVVKRSISLSELAGRRIAIDAYNSLYQFLSIIRQPDGTPLMDGRGRITSHLSGLFYRTLKLMGMGVKPIYVFDGEPPHLKRRTIEARAEMRDEAGRKWREALKKGDFEGARTYAQASSRLSREMVEDAKELLKAMGLPFVDAPHEGEAQAAHMCEKGDVFATASQDYDSLLLGSPRLIRNLAITGRRKLPRRKEYVEVKPELIDLEETLRALGIDRRKLVWIGIITGTDFNKGIKGIGPKKGLKLVMECNTLDEVIERCGGTEKFDIDPHSVEEYFFNPGVSEEYDISFKKPDEEMILRLLCDQHDFSRERVENAIKKLHDSLGAMEQSSLGKWF